jgi:hypothetical protein
MGLALKKIVRDDLKLPPQQSCRIRSRMRCCTKKIPEETGACDESRFCVGDEMDEGFEVVERGKVVDHDKSKEGDCEVGKKQLCA